MAARRPSSGSVASQESGHTRRSQRTNLDVFDDEFAEDYAESIRTTASTRRNPFTDPAVNYSPTSPTSDRQAFLPSTLPAEAPHRSRNSISKSSLPSSNMGYEESEHELIDDDATARTQDVPRRTLSIVSTSSALSPDSPSQSGPSHPYTMYPQNYALSRTASVATAAGRTGTPSQQRGPAHPYNMYPQTTSSDAPTDAANRSQDIPLGFPGRAPQFHRRLGPEGEEQDIIGPEGHTEQLPPYSRYPENYDNKAAAVGLLSSIPEPGEGSRAEPAVEMSERLRSDEIREHVGDIPVPPTEATSMVPGQGDMSEKPMAKRWKDKDWRGKLRHKIFGAVRVWMLLLLLLVIIVIATVCGGVIGSFLGRGRPNIPPSNPYTDHQSSSVAAAATTIVVTHTKYVDVTPISTPASMSPVPTGAYSIAFSQRVEHADCLDADYQNAWSCSFPSGQSDLQFSVSRTGAGYQMWMFNPDQITGYGTQPPNFFNKTLSLVQDYENGTMLGNSLQFSMNYSKLVVVEEGSLPTTDNAKRQISLDTNCTSNRHPFSASDSIPCWRTRKHISSTAKPWFCWFNNTYVDGFIYVSQEQNGSYASTYASVPPSSSYPVSATPSYSMSSYPTTFSTSIISSAPSSTVIPAYTVTSSSQSYMTAGSAVPTYHKRNSAYQSTITAQYPLLVKLEERRLSGATKPPVCTQMSQDDNGNFVPIFDGENPITTSLTETDPATSWNNQAGCYCQWANSEE